MKANLLIRRRVVFGDRNFAELVVWQVPKSVPPTEDGFKYRLVYIVDGERVIGFDNERGKGDHRHERDVETPYPFTGIDALLADFIDAVEAWRRVHGQD
jgi:hypothetical protein